MEVRVRFIKKKLGEVDIRRGIFFRVIFFLYFLLSQLFVLCTVVDMVVEKS